MKAVVRTWSSSQYVLTTFILYFHNVMSVSVSIPFFDNLPDFLIVTNFDILYNTLTL